MDDQEKVEYLSSYRRAMDECARIGGIIDAYRSIGVKARQHKSTTTKTERDLSDYVVLLEEKEQELMEAYKQTAERLEQISADIASVDDQEGRMILTAKFIQMKTMREIAEERHLSRRSLYRVYKKTLQKLKVGTHWHT